MMIVIKFMWYPFLSTSNYINPNVSNTLFCIHVCSNWDCAHGEWVGFR